MRGQTCGNQPRPVTSRLEPTSPAHTLELEPTSPGPRPTLSSSSPRPRPTLSSSSPRGAQGGARGDVYLMVTWKSEAHTVA
jgi:hypothetical protein